LLRVSCGSASLRVRDDRRGLAEMKMRFHRGMACFGGALVGLAGPAIAAEPADADGTSLTIYANNQALVQDVRVIAFVPRRLRFRPLICR